MRMVVGLLLLTLFADVLTNIPQAAAHAYVKPTPSPAQAMTNLQQFLKAGRQDGHDHGSFKHTATDAAALPAAKQTGLTPLPSTEPATMKDQAFVLDDTFVLNRPAVPAGTVVPVRKPQGVAAATIPSGTTPLQVSGSDGRLEVMVPRNAFDLAQAKLEDGSVPLGELTLQISQRSGHFIGASSILGTYQFQVLDAQGKALTGVQMRQPVTIRYHYTAEEMTTLGINPDHVLLTWPEQLLAAQQAKKPAASNLIVPMSNDAKTQTLTAQTTVLGGMAALTSTPDNQGPSAPHLASMSDNSGQLTYAYPLSVAPGPGGFVPELTLAYTSQSTNGRTNPRSPADQVGDGWSLGLGSISATTYTSGSTAPGTWYFLSGIGNVSDRLIPDTTAGFYQTEHISHLRIHFTGSFWQVWDRSGTYYELGNSSDSQQYTTSGTTKTTYQWNVNKILAPYNSTSQVKTMFVSYLQDATNGGNTIRDSNLKQIVYGYATSTGATSLSLTAGTVDFHYHMPSVPSGQGNWATAYSNNYNCSSSPPSNTLLRCDDPQTFNTINPPDVMSTMTLDSVTSYVGTDTTGSPAYSYAFSYQDNPYTTTYYDPYTHAQEPAAGEHLLTQITPSVYQSGTAHQRKSMQFSYTQGNNVYRDPSVSTGPGSYYGGQTFWSYLTHYQDLDTGVGGNITFQRAFGNTNGTPYVTDGNGNVTDDRHDPLYCTIHANDQDTSKQCIGVYLHPEDYSWTAQVVTQIQALGKDSSDSNLNLSTTTYAYRLAVTNSQGWNCHPITGSGVPAGEADCVGDNWIPGYNGNPGLNKDQDWIDYYHAEFRGFNAVYTTSPSGNLTADYYFSTEGWWKPQSDGLNYNNGTQYQHDVYWGNQLNDGNLLERVQNFYAGVTVPSGNPFNGINTCNGLLNATYSPCVVAPLRTRTTMYESAGISSSAPWLQTDYTYDDINPNTGLVNGYHNLLQTVTTSSNAPSFTQKQTFQINDQTTGGVTYYNVDKPVHSEIDDANGHVWNCQDLSYDEGRASGVPAPAAGWQTTSISHSDCTNQAGTALKTYTAYDVYGNVVATVDPFGAANSGLYSGNGCSLSTAPAYLSRPGRRGPTPPVPSMIRTTPRVYPSASRMW